MRHFGQRSSPTPRKTGKYDRNPRDRYENSAKLTSATEEGEEVVNRPGPDKVKNSAKQSHVERSLTISLKVSGGKARNGEEDSPMGPF